MLAVFFKKFVVWWELIVPILITVLFILIAKAIAISSLTDDVEYLGGYIKEVRYYEDWDEYIQQTCSRTCCCDSKGNCSTETYDCSYVLYHPERWEAITTLGTKSIYKEEYHALIRKFKVTPSFYDMKRDYDSNDGDMYFGKWQGQDDTLEPVTETHYYENRPKASSNIFHFNEVDTSDFKLYKPFNYPKIGRIFYQQQILGYNDNEAEKRLQVLNARCGSDYQVRVFILIYKNQPREASHVQEQYWQGGNKNELIVCVGINDSNKVQWANVFSWTEAEVVKVELRRFIEEQESLQLLPVIDKISDQVKNKWKRKAFKDFDYLNIEPTQSQTLWIFALTIILNVGIGIWVVKNEID